MKIKFSRRQVESICTYSAYVLLLLLLVLWIFYQADSAFNWDILPRDFQRIIEQFIIPSIGGTVLITAILSVLLNISLASISIEQIAQEKLKQLGQEKVDLTVSSGMRKALFFSIFAIVLILIGFKLWDKWQSNSRIHRFIKEYANEKNMKTIDSLLSKLNYQDSLQYVIQTNNNYTSIRSKKDSILGLSNIAIHTKLKVEFEKLNNNFIDKNNKRIELNSELFINFNKAWVEISNLGSHLVFDNSVEIIHLNSKDFMKRIFRKMDEVEITNNEGYEVYYRINNSRNFEIVIVSKSKPKALLNFKYSVWR